MTWRTCPIDGCLVSSYDPHCPACHFRLTGPLEQAWSWQ